MTLEEEVGDQPRLLDPFYKNTEGGREEKGREGEREEGRERGLCLIFKQDI